MTHIIFFFFLGIGKYRFQCSSVEDLVTTGEEYTSVLEVTRLGVRTEKVSHFLENKD